MATEYNEEFKKQIVKLVDNGKQISEIVEKYKITKSTVHKGKKSSQHWFFCCRSFSRF